MAIVPAHPWGAVGHRDDRQNAARVEGFRMTHMIKATGVVKRFGEKLALDGLELSAEQGTIMAVLGPNGAGKTTFVRCIATLTEPDAGTLRVFGYDVVREPRAVQSSI